MTPIFVAEAAGRYGMGVGMTSLAVLYVAAVVLLLSTRHLTRRAVMQTRAVETGR